MAASSTSSGETLIVRHIPLAHGQSVGFQLYSTGQKPIRPCYLKLTHSISLPEREEPSITALDSDFQSHSSKSSSNDDAGGADKVAKLSRWSDSSPTFELSSSQGKMENTGNRSTPRWQNPFLPELEAHEDEEEDDSDGDNLHKYREGSSFQLHGNSNGTQDQALGYTPEIWLTCSTRDKACSPVCSHNLKMLNQDGDLFGTSVENKEVKNLMELGLQQRRDSKSTPILMDCEEQEWGDEEDYDEYVQKERTCENHKISDAGSSTQKQAEYISDSSCNSSDGVLVSFSAIYNKTNNAVPATPHDLDSPAQQSHGSGSVSRDEGFKPVPCWSPCGLDPNCNIYLLGSDGLVSLEISDLTDCLQSQGRLMTSTQNYYKLVTCDLSSQSSLSPAWSSVTSCSEVHSQGSLTPPKEYFLFGQPEGNEEDELDIDQRGLQVNEDLKWRSTKNSTEPSNGARERKSRNAVHNPKSGDPEPNHHESSSFPLSQSWNGRQDCWSAPKLEALPRVPSCPSQINLDLSSGAPKQHVTSFAELARGRKAGGDPSSVENSMEAPSCSKFPRHASFMLRKAPLRPNLTVNTSQDTRSSERSGICQIPESGSEGTSPEVVRYSKAQRPTFLPIQPLVLQPPSGTQQSMGLGSLLNQYISQKPSKPSKLSSSRSTGKCKGRSCYLQPSPLGGYSAVHLDAATSSDTCSTCTPSPVQPHIQSRWTRPSLLLAQNHPEPDQRQSNPKTLDSKSPKAAGKSLSRLKETSLGPFLTMEPLQRCYPEKKTYSPTSSPALKEAQGQTIPLHHSFSPAITSVTSLMSKTSLRSRSSDGRRLRDPLEVPNTGLLVREKQHHLSNSFHLTNRPPEEFCLSPDEVCSIDLLQKKGLLRTVGLAVDLITTHFSSSRDPEEKIRLGNSSLCPRIGQLILGQLCPAIRNVLQDGLKAFKLDLIVGQRRNKPWGVVEASTRPGPSTRILHSLASVIRKSSQLTNHSTRVNAFLMGLLNLRALESWFRHLHTCADVVDEFYHHWAFLALSQGPAYRSWFQELLLLLQPLNQLPFDLHLLSELSLLRRPSEKPPRSQGLPIPFIETNDGPPERHQQGSCGAGGSHIAEKFQGSSVKFCKEPTLCIPQEEDEQKFISLVSSERECAGWWLGQTPVTEGFMVGDCADSDLCRRNDEDMLEESCDTETVEILQTSQQDGAQNELRWARLFGSAIGTSGLAGRAPQNNSRGQRTRLPSQWLKLGASQVDLLAQSVWGRDSSRTLCEGETRSKQRH